MNDLIHKFKKSFHGLLSALIKDDQEFRNLIFLIRNRRRLNLANPVTFFEKLNWMMNHIDYRRYAPLADKYEVRDYVKRKGYNHYLNQIYGVYSNESEIDFDNLPNSFIMKSTHASGMVLICKDKTTLNFDKVRRTCREWLKTDYSKRSYEINYADVPHRMICEKLLHDDDGNVAKDYKIFCFHGKPRYIAVDFDRFGKGTQRIYTSDWIITPYLLGFKFHPESFPKPSMLDEMLHFAEDISVEFPFVRVDLYQVEDKIIFGELTFTPNGGTPKVSIDCDMAFGSYLDLPKIYQKS